MKKISFILISLLWCNLFAQDCPVQQKIEEEYPEDVKILALREIHNDADHAYADSVEIPQELVNRYLQILSAVYKTEHDAVDSVFNIYDIQARPVISYWDIVMLVDTSYTWVQDYFHDSLVSGNAKFDSIMLKYDFKLESYNHLGTTTYMRISSDNYLNLYPLIDSLKTIQGVNIIEPNALAGDGNDINVVFEDDSTFVNFSVGWGDCPAGCTSTHSWKFAVVDCQGIYLGSSGDDLTNIQSFQKTDYRIYPNPVENYLQIEPFNDITNIDVYNAQGAQVKSIKQVSGVIDLSGLNTGLYVLMLNNKDETRRVKIIKR